MQLCHKLSSRIDDDEVRQAALEFSAHAAAVPKARDESTSLEEVSATGKCAIDLVELIGAKVRSLD